MEPSDLKIIIKMAAKEVWQNNISTDYRKNRLRREASLQYSFYYHLRNKIGDATLDYFNAVIYTEYHYKGKRVDLAIIQLIDNETIPLAIFEFKYKDTPNDKEFLKDVNKIVNYIDDADECIFYIGFIQEAEFADLNDNFTWLNNHQRKKATGRVVEMTGGLFRPGEAPKWGFKEI